ncbi:MAG: hypothetical protein LBC27_10140 [Spirochaetaceae bacterium]|jgi:hypothetical protein|nr:hypothetical protein [Spirochaetaceae bacterium]
MKKKILLCAMMLSGVLIIAQAQDASAGSDQVNTGVEPDGQTKKILEAAREEILVYFRRYEPTAQIIGNTVSADAKYGRYPVHITVTAHDDTFDISIVSDVKDSYIGKWKANLIKNIRNRLQ